MYNNSLDGIQPNAAARELRGECYNAIGMPLSLQIAQLAACTSDPTGPKTSTGSGQQVMSFLLFAIMTIANIERISSATSAVDMAPDQS